jgi:hypothetical protein
MALKIMKYIPTVLFIHLDPGSEKVKNPFCMYHGIPIKVTQTIGSVTDSDPHSNWIRIWLRNEVPDSALAT